MNNLSIIQSKSSTEQVTSVVIEKLYQLALTSKVADPSSSFTMNLQGNISAPAAYEDSVEYLQQKFQDLIINIPDGKFYLRFEDPVIEQLCITHFGDGTGITKQDASVANLGTTFQNNTEITSFNEFKYFTKANTSPPKDLFQRCSNLEEVDLSSATTISRHQFSQSGIRNINAPNLITLGLGAFSGCSQLETVESLGHITSIADSAFRGSHNLVSVTLPDECTTLDVYAFFVEDHYTQGGSLQTLTGINHITNFGGNCLKRQLPLQITASDIANAVSIGSGAFWYVRIPSINCPNLINLDSSAFRENKVLSTVECLGKINNIPSNCFNSDTSLTTVTIPYECTTIKSGAFGGCSSLTTFKQYTSSVNDWVEGETPGKGVINRVTSFEGSCFQGCSSLQLTSNDIGNATSIGDGAFRDSAFYGDLSIPYMSGDLTQNAFRNCKSLTSISNLGNITSICKNARRGYGEGSFTGCTSLTSVVIPSTVTIIGSAAFAGCLISNINITWENITQLGSSAFDGRSDWNFIVNLANLTNTSPNFLGKQRGTTYVRQLYVPKVESGDIEGYYSSDMYYEGCFTGISTDILYLKNIRYLYPGDFAWTSCANLVINNTTPPEWRNKQNKADGEVSATDSRTRVFSRSTINNIYVPDSAVSAYQNDSNWSTMSDKIKPLSQLAKVATEANLQEGQIALIQAYM